MLAEARGRGMEGQTLKRPYLKENERGGELKTMLFEQ